MGMVTWLSHDLYIPRLLVQGLTNYMGMVTWLSHDLYIPRLLVQGLTNYMGMVTWLSHDPIHTTPPCSGAHQLHGNGHMTITWPIHTTPLCSGAHQLHGNGHMTITWPYTYHASLFRGSPTTWEWSHDYHMTYTYHASLFRGSPTYTTAQDSEWGLSYLWLTDCITWLSSHGYHTTTYSWFQLCSNIVLHVQEIYALEKVGGLHCGLWSIQTINFLYT